MSDETEKKDKKKKEEERVYTGTKVAADPDFAEWIVKQWKRGESLQRIDVIEYFTRGAQKGFGQPVDWEVFATNHDVNLEEAVELSNRFLGSAQVNCDRIHEKEMRYYARAFDKGRGAVSRDGVSGDPVDTFPLHLFPKTKYVDDSVGDSEEVTEKQLALDYLRDGMKAYQFDRTREDNNVGDLISMFLNERKEQRLWEIEQQKTIREILKDWVQAIRDREQALSTEADNAPRREMAKIKAEMIRETFMTGKSYLSKAFGGYLESKASKDAAKGNGTNGNGNSAPMTQERLLLENLFRDCETAKIEKALFGEWEIGEGNIAKNIKPGIFTPDQYAVLVEVFKGNLPAEALDDLMPDSGRPLAITGDQIEKAQNLEGMNQGIAMSLGQLLSVRQQKKAEAAKSKQVVNSTATVPKENDDV